MNNLKRALRQISQGTFRKLAFWTILTVAAETLAIDLASSLFQLVSLGHIQQQLLLSPDLLGLPRTRGILPGHILLLLSGLIVFSLGLRLFFGQVCEKLTGLIESSIAGELRTRLFRECHRTSGQLITPDAAEQTLSLIQSAARDYGRARSLILRQRLAYLVRGIAGILLLGLVRWDISLMVSAGIFLSFILELRYQEKSQTCEALDNQVEQKIRNEFHEELRESYQARVIGSERGKGRPSDDWIERWSQIDQKSQNVRLLNVSTRNWGRLAIFSTVLFALSIRISAGQTLSTGSTIALLTVMSCSFLSWIFSRFGVGVFQDDSKWIIPI
ncbi:MAG: hypothetical protein RJA81_1332, partial [Planctomycetota bacterium]